MSEITIQKILCVDDEVQMTRLLSRALSPDFENLQVVNSAEEAKKIVKAEEIALVVLDLNMPDQDGLSLLEDLRKIRPELSCVFLTGYGDKDHIKKAVELGIDNFIEKPFEPPYLKLAILRALEKHYYETLTREVLELFIQHYTQLDFSTFKDLSADQKHKTLHAALALAKLKIENKKLSDTSSI